MKQCAASHCRTLRGVSEAERRKQKAGYLARCADDANRGRLDHDLAAELARSGRVETTCSPPSARSSSRPKSLRGLNA